MYYFLNIKYDCKSQSWEWLEKRNRAPIFFDNTRINEILYDETILREKHQLHWMQIKDSRLFCELGRNRSLWPDTVIVTIDSGYVWLYRPVDEITEKLGDTEYDGYVKSFPIEFLCERRDIADVPFILASMKTNMYFSMGTFKLIPEKYIGNILAVEYLLGNDLTKVIRNLQFHPLDCLASVELETLIAKIFESQNCFVPAYRGGLLSDVDLFVWNYGESDLDIDGVFIPKGKRKSVQVKINFSKSDLAKSNADYNIGCDQKHGDKHFGRQWIWKQVMSNFAIQEWITLSLDWLPREILFPHNPAWF
jgi:hypothetical protein